MPTKNLSDTEINPTYTAPYGGGERTASETETTPTYLAPYGGGRRTATEIEITPSWETIPVLSRNAGLSPVVGELIL
ncbi:hypothetical protein ES703_51168 [subsurface metagenome]